MYDDVIATLCDLEKRIDTLSLTYADVNYWPLCRLRLWSHLTHAGFKSSASQSDKKVSNTGPSFADVGRVTAAPFGNPQLGLLLTDATAGEAMAQSGALSPDILFFLRPEEYRDAVAGQAYAKMLDSVYDRAKAYHRLKIELADPKVMGFARHFPSAFFHFETAAQSASFDPPAELVGFDQVSAALEDKGIAEALSKDAVDTDMGKIFYFARLFDVALQGLSPRLVILSVYYHPVGMALMLAAHRRGIPTVDVQHGRLGPYHGLYTQLTAAPPEGYALVPNTIWCWGAQTKHDIEVDKNPACAHHSGIVGGNPWLDRWMNGNASDQADEKPAALFDKSKDKKKILVSLQPLDMPLPDCVIEAMANGPSDWIWWLRLHPLRRHTASELEQLLKERGIENVELEESTDLPLFRLLKACDHHITAFSSVALEALAFGKRTTLFSDVGLGVFPRQIDKDLMSFANTGDDLIARIAEAIDAQPPKDDMPFIDSTPGLAERALEALLRDSGD